MIDLARPLWAMPAFLRKQAAALAAPENLTTFFSSGKFA